MAAEGTIRLAAFLAIFLAMAAAEIAAPRRPPHRLKGRRWLTNLAIVAVDSLVLRVVFPMAAVGAAVWAESRGYGLLRAVAAPGWLAGLAAFVVLDFAVWLEHVASHKIPLLWRIHRVHHSDVDFDLTTALRFHPLEILISMLWKAGLVVALGAPVLSVLLFEIVLNGAAMFNHANLRLPPALDRRLRLVIVTPDMHRIHHSVRPYETDSNYGFNFSLWDRLFAVYREEPEDGHLGMRIGLSEHQNEAPAGFVWSLLFPFRGRPQNSPTGK